MLGFPFWPSGMGLDATPTDAGCDRIGDRFVFKRHAPRNEDATLSVYCDGDECRINVAPTAMTIPPHVGRIGMLAWLDDRSTVAVSEKSELQALRKAIAALP